MKIKNAIIMAIALATTAMGGDLPRLVTGATLSQNDPHELGWALSHPTWECVTNKMVTRTTNYYTLTSMPPINKVDIRETVDEEVRSNFVAKVWYKGVTQTIILETTPPVRRTRYQYNIKHKLVEERTLVSSNAVALVFGHQQFQVMTNNIPVEWRLK